MNGVDQDLEQKIRADERATTANRIAGELTRKTCSEICEHPSCTSYRFAARTARLAGEQPVIIPTQPRPRP